MRRFIVAAALTVGLAAPARAQSGEPILRIETGAHTAKMGAAAADAAGRVLVTASEDKTARIWSLPDLRALGVLRLPIGPGNEGNLYAAAVSPDGRFAAVGGWIGQTGGEEAVLLFDLQTRQVVRRWGELPNADVLAISGDGRRIAAGLGSGGGIRVWELNGDRPALSDAAYGDSVYGIAFAPDGGMVTSSLDGFLRLYDLGGRPLRKVAAVAGTQPFRVAFSPDGTKIAVGFHDVAAVEVRDGRTLEVLVRPDASGLSASRLSHVAWSSDGRTLFVGGDPWIDGGWRALAWADAGRGRRRVVGPGFTSPVFDLVPLRGGGLVSTSFSGDLVVLAANGERRAERHPIVADLTTSGDANDATRRFLVPGIRVE
jgi:hypothetical protein